MCRKYCSKTRTFFSRNFIHLAMKTRFALHGLAHVKPLRVVKLKGISILMHLRIISAESDNITDRKLKFLYVRRLFTFWRPIEVKSKQHTRFGFQKNSIAPAGKAINTYGWNFSLLSSSYQLQCRYASRMCLVENAQHERIFAYIQSWFARTKPRVNCFVHRYCFVLEN